MSLHSMPLRTILVAGMLLASVATAEPKDHNPALIRVLSAIDIVPTPAQLAEVTGEHPEQELYAVALDATLREYLRSRATSLLSVFPNKQTAAFLESIANTTEVRSIRWMAVYTRVRTFADDAALDFGERMLTSPVTRMRHAVVRALRWVPGKRSTTLLETQLARETDARLRKTIQRMLSIRR